MKQSGLNEDELNQFSTDYLTYLIVYYADFNASTTLIQLKELISTLFYANLIGGTSLKMFSVKDFSSDELTCIKDNVHSRVEILIEDRGEEALLIDILGIKRGDESRQLRGEVVEEIKNRLEKMGVCNEKV